MRASLPTTILALATALALLGGSAKPIEAGAPGVAQATDKVAPSYQGEIIPPGQTLNQGQGPVLGQGSFANQGPCEGPMDGFAGGGPCGPCWTFAAEVIALERTNTRSVPLFVPAPADAPKPLDANQLDFPVAYGPKLSAIRHGVCGFDVEVLYFQVDGFTGQALLPGTSRMIVDMADTNLMVTDGIGRYTSALYNGELNVRRRWTDWLTLLAGFRMVELDEHYFGCGTDFYNALTDSLATNTFNHLYGGQIGAEAEVFNRGGPLQINVLGKAGVFGNAAEQNYQVVPGGIIVDQLDARSCSQTSFLGEAGAVATYAVTKHLAFRASLDAIWLTGVALAPEQINSVNLRRRTDVVNSSGGVFYYGGGLGMECRF